MKKGGNSRGLDPRIGRSPKEPEDWPINPAVDLDVAVPADVKATIGRGEAAAKKQALRSSSVGNTQRAGDYNFTMSIVDQEKQDRRDAILDARAQQAKGKRAQPPMTERMHFALVMVGSFEAKGIPFGVAPNSKMNKALRKWLNEKAARSPEERKSRRKQITPGAVRELLKQVKALRVH
jgi:hypothetical protein